MRDLGDTLRARGMRLTPQRVCLSCGAVIESAVTIADPFVGNLLTRNGFVADVKHMAIHGWCEACSAQASRC